MFGSIDNALPNEPRKQCTVVVGIKPGETPLFVGSDFKNILDQYFKNTPVFYETK